MFIPSPEFPPATKCVLFAPKDLLPQAFSGLIPGDEPDYDNKSLFHVIIMVRTQISLSEEEYEAAKREAQRLGISLAELLRRSLRTMLPVDEARPWMRYAGMIESGDPKASQRTDEVVYGHKD